MKPHEIAMEKTKMALMMKPNTVFYTTILFSLQLVWAEDDHPLWQANSGHPTAAVDGITLWVNPGFFMGLTEGQRITLLVHEVLHVAFSHMSRRGERHARFWNYAGDYVINWILVTAGYEPLDSWLLEEKYKEFNTEQLFDILWKKRIVIPWAWGDIIYPADGVSAEDIDDKIKDILIRATIQSQASNDSPGAIPGQVLIDMKKLLDPKLPWEVILQNHMANFAKADYSMNRPNRRFLPGYYLPTQHSPALSNLVITVDSSGSTTHNDQFHYFVTEIAAIQERLRPDKITLIDWDTKIRSVQDITADTDILREIEFTGGGGTNIKETIDWVIEHNPPCVLTFSDGEFSMPAARPTSPFIWLIHNDDSWNAPYGKVIHYNMKENAG